MSSTYEALEKRRAALQMSKVALAVRAQVSVPTVNRILSGKQPDVSVSSLNRIAKALGVEVRLTGTTEFREVQPALEFRLQQAHTKAQKLIDLLQGTMALEAQGVNAEHASQMVDKTVVELLGSPRKLWGA